MTTITLLGTGLLGSGMVENLLQKGHRVQVWNRSAEKLAPLVQKGAIQAASPAEAVRGAERVHLVLAEDSAVDAVIESLRPGLAQGVPIYDHSTNHPQRTKARATTLRKAGIHYVPAPVFMSPQNAREASGLMLLGAPQDEAQAHEAWLAPMTGKVFYVGERLDLAAVYKLAGNSLFFAMAAAMSDVLAMGRNSGVATDDMLALFSVFKPGGALPLLGRRVADAETNAASFELQMARKDARLMLETAGQEKLHVLPAIAAAMDRAIAAGRAKADYTAFTRA